MVGVEQADWSADLDWYHESAIFCSNLFAHPGRFAVEVAALRAFSQGRIGLTICGALQRYWLVDRGLETWGWDWKWSLLLSVAGGIDVGRSQLALRLHQSLKRLIHPNTQR